MEKDKMHRAVKIGTGKVTYVSGALAKDPDLLLDYGFILQELPDTDFEEGMHIKVNLPTFVNISDALKNEEEKSEFAENFISITEEMLSDLPKEVQLDVLATAEQMKDGSEKESGSKPKRTYNKQTK